VTYSYSQLSHYLSCPRRYRHRYLDGWQEKDTRAAMLFGRCFEQALGAYFRKEDAAVTLYREWSQYQKQPLLIHLLDDEGGQGMVEYLLIVSLVVLTIVGLFARLMHLLRRVRLGFIAN
jgi:Flp pilus assembly pilin Flp